MLLSREHTAHNNAVSALHGLRYDRSVRAFAERYAAWLYFALTFAISWTTVFLAVGPGGFPGTEEDFARLLTPVVAAMLLGPSVAGVLVAVLSGQWADYKDRLLLFRVSGRWYAYALLIAPLSIVLALLVLSRSSSVHTPGVVAASDPMMHTLIGLMTGVAAGLFEELGWTGVAIPAVRKRSSWIGTGLIVGFFWGAWHLLVTWWGSAPSIGGVPMWQYLLVMDFAFLVPYRILMVRMFDATPSIPMAMIMHFALTGSVRVFDPLGIQGNAILVYTLSHSALMWVVIAWIAHRDRRARFGPDSART